MLVTKLLNKMGVFPEERVLLFWSMLHGFATGCFLSILSSVPMALFLSTFDSSALSYGFIANAIATLFIGALFVMLEKKISFSKLQLGVVFIIVTSIILSWLGLTVSKASWIIACTLILSWVIFDFATFEFWSVLNRLYNLQQAKRLFGLIGMVSSLAGIIMGLITPSLIFVIGLTQLLLIASAWAGIAWLALYKLKKLYPEKIDYQEICDLGEVEDELERAKKLNFKNVFKNRYFLLIMGFCVVTICLSLGLDVLFNTVAESHYPNENALGAFLSIFSALIGVARLFLSMISFYLLKRIGVIVAILLHAFFTLILASIAFLGHWLPDGDVVIFYGVLAIYLFYASYGAGIKYPSFLVLLQPLTQNDRSWMHSKIEAIINPIATGLMGGFILLIKWKLGISAMTFLPPIIIFSVIAFLITLALKPGYITALNNSLTKPYLFNLQLNNIDKNILPLLEVKLASPYPEEILFALTSLEKLDTAEYIKVLERAINSPHGVIREYALLQVVHYPQAHLFEKIRIALNEEALESVRSAAYQALATSPHVADHKIVVSGMDEKNHIILYGAISGVLKYLNQYHTLAREKLLILLKHSDAEKRCCAAKIIGENKITTLTEFLVPLIHDNAFSVRCAAIIACGELQDVPFLLAILETDNVSLSQSAVVQAMISGGAALTEELSPHFDNFNATIQQLIAKSTSYNEKSDVAIKLLTEHMSIQQKSVRHQIFLALMKLQYQSDKQNLRQIDNLLEEELTQINLDAHKVTLIPNTEETQALRSLFHRFLWLDKERLLVLLSFKHGSEKLLRIKRALENNNAEQTSYALELLYTMVSPQHKKNVTSIFNIKHEESTLKNEDAFNALLEEIIINAQESYNYWIVAAAIHYIGSQRKVAFVDKLMAYKNSSKELLKETSHWALEKLTAS